MQIQLIAYKSDTSHVSQDTVSEFEGSIRTGNVFRKDISGSKRLRKLISKILFYLDRTLSGVFEKRADRVQFCILMGDEFHKVIPSMFCGSNNIYFFDAWPAIHPKIERFIKIYEIKNVFFSSKEVTEIFKKKQLKCNFHWVPEGIDVDRYRRLDYSKKDIDVLSFGRRYDVLHEQIVDGLKDSGYCYLYEKKRGALVFKTRDSFLNGLSRAKISICIPSNITHPDRAGDISTVTVRYLQSMASKVLVVGLMPLEMKDLFGYNPIVELDMDNPLAHLQRILTNYNDYIPMIEENYKFITSNHCWINRWSDIEKVLKSEFS